MNQRPSSGDRSRGSRPSGPRWAALYIPALVGAAGLLTPRCHPDWNGNQPVSAEPEVQATASPPRGNRQWSNTPAVPAKKVVAEKLRQFTQSRHALARLMVQSAGAELPDYMEQFFRVVETGDWPEIESQWNAIGARALADSTPTYSIGLSPTWCAVMDVYRAAEQVHQWPAQQLLDYGQAILGALTPGMVYVGGTDSGCFIPQLLDETRGGETHVILSQQALSDPRYIEYLRILYGNRIATPTMKDYLQASAAYSEDAWNRFEHDQRFPEAPKQLKREEEWWDADGTFELGGEVASMAIGEKLLQILMAGNPDLPFAIQESTSLQGTYADAVPRGPLVQLGSKEEAAAFTAEQAAETVDYWRNRTAQLQSDPEVMASPYALKAHAHDTVSAATLLAARGFTAEAEQAYRLAGQLWADNPESMSGLAKILTETGRQAEARQLIESFVVLYPERRSEFESVLGAEGQTGASVTMVPKP